MKEQISLIDQRNQKPRRKKSLNDLLNKISNEKRYALQQESINNSRLELFNALVQELKGKDEKEPKK